MSKSNTGGPAFPRAGFSPEGYGVQDMEPNDAQDGMSLRDYFAGQIIAGIQARHTDCYPDDHDAAKRAYAAADAMVTAREAPAKTPEGANPNWTAEAYASEALAALAGAGICTPEAGYLKDGGPSLMGADIRRLREQRDKLQQFKDWVHAYLDARGVPADFPDGQHTKEGCRIGDRMDWLMVQRDKPMEACRLMAAALCGFTAAELKARVAEIHGPAFDEAQEALWAAVAESGAGLPSCTSCGRRLTDGGVKDGDHHLCLRCGGS